jgi:hypothetical protein
MNVEGLELRESERRPVFVPEVHECAACRRIIAEMCNQSQVQQSWFRLAERPGPCPAHQEEAGRG